jgi:hypothetical protein
MKRLWHWMCNLNQCDCITIITICIGVQALCIIAMGIKLLLE